MTEGNSQSIEQYIAHSMAVLYNTLGGDRPVVDGAKMVRNAHGEDYRTFAFMHNLEFGQGLTHKIVDTLITALRVDFNNYALGFREDAPLHWRTKPTIVLQDKAKAWPKAVRIRARLVLSNYDVDEAGSDMSETRNIQKPRAEALVTQLGETLEKLYHEMRPPKNDENSRFVFADEVAVELQDKLIGFAERMRDWELNGGDDAETA